MTAQGRDTAGRSGLPRWDFRLPKSMLSDYEMRVVAYGISSALHHTTGIPSCRDPGPTLCAMCGNAVRLVLQAAEPKLIEAFLHKSARALGLHYIDLHPRSADD